MNNFLVMQNFLNGLTAKGENPRKTSDEIKAQIDKVEKKLDDVLNRFICFTDGLYIHTDGENFAHVDMNGKFVNLWEVCKEGTAEFETVTQWIKPEEIYIDLSYGQEWCFEKYPEAFRRLHLLENYREELLDQREKLLDEWFAQNEKGHVKSGK